MVSQYTHRFVLLVALADRVAANQDAAALDPDEGGENTFAVPLSPDGLEPATYFGASTMVREVTRAAINGPLRAKYPNAHVYDCTALGWPDDTSWSLALEDAGLQLIEGGG